MIVGDQTKRQSWIADILTQGSSPWRVTRARTPDLAGWLPRTTSSFFTTWACFFIKRYTQIVNWQHDICLRLCWRRNHESQIHKAHTFVILWFVIFSWIRDYRVCIWADRSHECRAWPSLYTFTISASYISCLTSVNQNWSGVRIPFFPALWEYAAKKESWITNHEFWRSYTQ